MVVKPADWIVRGKKGLVQPAVKCRGKEYLRIIYSPDYDSEENLSRLRKGPIHWAAKLGTLAIEVYPAQSADEVDSTTRLGFSVGDVEALLATLRTHNVEIVNNLKQTKWGLRAVVKDPDGRSVELVQESD